MPTPIGLADEATCWIRVGTGWEPVEASLSEHAAVLPPLLPTQVHDHGPLPLTADAVPVEQRFAVGLALTVAPFEEPHAPFTGGLEAIFVAEQVAVVPPLLPAQLHAHGPLPPTDDAAPAMQRLAVGALMCATPAAAPHTPFTRCEGGCFCACA